MLFFVQEAEMDELEEEVEVGEPFFSENKSGIMNQLQILYN